MATPLQHLLIITTLPHFAAALPPLLLLAQLRAAPGTSRSILLLTLYAATILLSSSLSVAWHAAGEPAGWLMKADYAAAAVWTCLELLLSLHAGSCSGHSGHSGHNGYNLLLLVAALNVLTISTNKAVDVAASRKLISYTAGHSAWHVLSAAKCVAIAVALSAAVIGDEACELKERQ